MTTAGRLAVGVTGYVVVAALVGDRGGPALCGYRRLTRRPCPACGLSRSVARFVRGDLRGARAVHRAGPLVVIGAAAAVWSTVAAAQ